MACGGQLSAVFQSELQPRHSPARMQASSPCQDPVICLPRITPDYTRRDYNRRMSQLLEVRTTFATPEDAISVGRAVVSERLAACAQVMPGVTSIYFWQEMLRHEAEVLLLLKTTDQAWPALRDRLVELHPYDTPELVALKAEQCSFDYLAWVRENTR